MPTNNKRKLISTSYPSDYSEGARSPRLSRFSLFHHVNSIAFVSAKTASFPIEHENYTTLNNRRTRCKFFKTAVIHLLNNRAKKLHDIRPSNVYVIHTHYLYSVSLHFFGHPAVSYPNLGLPGIPQFLHTESRHYFETGHIVFHPNVTRLTHNRPPISNSLSNWISFKLRSSPRGVLSPVSWRTATDP
jgi:hypothetical protein